jgi:hypothetical protein
MMIQFLTQGPVTSTEHMVMETNHGMDEKKDRNGRVKKELQRWNMRWDEASK